MIYIFLPFFNILRLRSELHANDKPQAAPTSVIKMRRILFILLGFFSRIYNSKAKVLSIIRAF